MNDFIVGTSMSQNKHRLVLKTGVAVLAAAGLLAAFPVLAQEVAAEPAAAPLDSSAVVNVTGVRKAAQSAQYLKQNAEQVIDSIVADDIGKFPDKNVAEILGRVPGVQIIRDNGEAGQVIIRGLGGIVTTLNGREMFTAAGRSLFLADVPVAMLQRVDVYKSQGADMNEGGVAGVIDVRTNRPFDFKGQQTAVNARVEHRDKAGSTDPNLSGMVSDRWKTAYGEVGLLGGISYQRGRYHDETAWVAPPINWPLYGNTQGADSMGRVMGQGDRKRWAGNFSAQWRPNSDLELYAEGFSTKINHDSSSVFFVGVLPWFQTGSTVTNQAGTKYLDSISKNGATDLFTLSSTQARRDESTGHQGAIGGRYNLTPSLRVTTELARTVSNYTQENPILDAVLPGPLNISAAVRDGGGYLQYNGIDMTSPNKWVTDVFWDNHNASSGRATDWRSDVIWEPENQGILKELAGGVRIAKRFATYVHELNNFNKVAAIPVTSLSSSLNCVTQATGGNYGMNQFYAPCQSYLLDHTQELRTALGLKGRSLDDPLSYYSDTETTSALYLKAKLAFDVGSVPVDGSVGARYVQTNQKVNGYTQVTSATGASTITPAYSDSTTNNVLPSASLRAKWSDTLQSRLVAGKAIQRANFGDFNPGLVLHDSTATTLATGSAGNPNLRPTQSANVDLSLEWYFAPASSLTGTVFEHRFTDYEMWKQRSETINGKSYLVNRPYNVGKAKLQGGEISYQQFFTMLPGWMSGLGMQANYTYMKGGLQNEDGSSTTPTFPGMSKNSYNLVGLYENDKLSARLAYSWRDKFVAEYNYRNCCDLVVDPIKFLDASVSYKLSKDMTISVDANNLLNFAYHDYHGTPAAPRDVRRYDRVIGVALRWRN